MSTDDNDPVGPALRQAWRAGRERTPEALDRAVLEAAAKVRAQPAGSGWLRPFAFAATLVLGIFLVQERLDIPERPQSPAEAARPAAVAPDPAPERRRADSADEALPASREPAADMAIPTKPGTGSSEGDRVESAAEAPAVRQRFEKAAGNTASTLREFADTAPAGAAAGRAAVDGPAPACGDNERERADDWWHCIRALREAGDDDAAARELELLQRQFPDFRLPE